MHFIEIRIGTAEYRFETDDLDKFKDVVALMCHWIKLYTESED